MGNLTEVKQVKDSNYCANGVPSYGEFISSIDSAKSFVVAYPAVFLILIVWLFSRSLRKLIENAPKNIKSNCIALISIYPIVSVCSFVAILVPRAYFFMDTIGHVAFMIISYQLYRYKMLKISTFLNLARKRFTGCWWFTSKAKATLLLFPARNRSHWRLRRCAAAAHLEDHQLQSD